MCAENEKAGYGTPIAFNWDDLLHAVKRELEQTDDPKALTLSLKGGQVWVRTTVHDDCQTLEDVLDRLDAAETQPI